MNSSTKIFVGLVVVAAAVGGAYYFVHKNNTKNGKTKYQVGDNLKAWGTTFFTVAGIITAVGPPTQPNFTAGDLYYVLQYTDVSATDEVYFLVSTVDNSQNFVKV